MKKNKKEIMKKIGSIVVAGTILLGSNSIVLAKENNYVSANNIRQNKTNTQEEIEVYYNGEKIEFDQKPILVNDRTLVPFRKVFESMGCIVYYNNSESKVMALTKEGDILTHTIGTNTFELNGEEKTFDSASTILNDRTLIPLRAVAETLSAEVEWNDKEQTVTIEKEESTLDEIEKEVISHVLDVNYNPKDTKRYVEYRKQHPELSIEQVIMDVNMDLDREYILVTVNNKEGDITYNGLSHYEADPKDVEPATNLDSMTVLVNGYNSIPKDYEPKDLVEHKYAPTGGISPTSAFLRKEAEEQYTNMSNAYNLETGEHPNNLRAYENYLNYNQASSELYSYRFEGMTRIPQGTLEKYAFDYSINPNCSEFRTGLTISLMYSENIMYEYIVNNYRALTEQEQENYNSNLIYQQRYNEMYNWLKNNAYKYGFVERFPEDKKFITRREYQPWVYRYVGIDVATKMHEENLCLEEYNAKYLNPTVYETGYSIEKESTEKVLQKTLNK